MEWVETTGRTIEEAKSLALDKLGVDDSDAEFDILDEPRAGLFGRVRGEARVRARVRPTQARAKVERRDRKKRPDKAATDTDTVDTESSAAVGAAAISNSDAPKASARKPRGARPTSSSGETPPVRKTAPRGADDKETVVDAEQVGQEAQRFIQELVTAFGLEGTTTVQCEGDEIDVRVEGSELGVLVGPRGTTLQAVQELARVAAQRRLGDHDTRLRVDVGGYRERRKEALGRFAHQVAAQVVTEGSAKRLEPMSSSDRKVIHDVLATYEGVVTHSEGEDPRRCVVIAPSND